MGEDRGRFSVIADLDKKFKVLAEELVSFINRGIKDLYLSAM